jgi:UDP-glucose 4-epimerase
VPSAVVRAAVAAAWHARVVPAEPGFLALLLGLPQLDAGRARRELGWDPRHSGVEAIEAFLAGMARGAGRPEPPLRRDSVKARLDELRAGVGSRDPVSE